MTEDIGQTLRPKLKIVDSNEPGEMRMKLIETGWEQRHLSIGDYWWFTHDYKKVGVERKAIGDLLASIGDKLSRQLENMLDHYDLNILLLEGSWQKVSTGELITARGIQYQTWTMVWNYLRRWQDKGITLELTINEGHTIHRLNELYALYQKPYSLSAGTRDVADERVLAFPSGCRGKTGIDCLAYFGSLADIANAFPDELEEVEGIGSKRAELIYNHFHKGETEVNASALTEPEPEELDINIPTQSRLLE